MKMLIGPALWVILAAGSLGTAVAQPQFKVTGKITDSNGAPAPGVQMFVLHAIGMEHETRSDDAGHYEITWQKFNFGAGVAGPDRHYFLLARDTGHNVAAIHAIDERTTNLDLRLQSGMTLTARAVDARDRPVTNATAFLSIYADNGGASLRSSLRADADGRIEINAMPPGLRYGLFVSAVGYGSLNQEVQAGDTGTDHYQFPKFMLKTAGHKLAGQVVDAAGQPVADAVVFLFGDGQASSNARTDAEGRFSFDKVVEGRAGLQAVAAARHGNVTTHADDTNVIIQIRADGGR